MRVTHLHLADVDAGGGELDDVMGLRCARANVILAVILGMTNLKAVGSKNGQINGREIFMQLPKRLINILRKVTPRRTVRPN